MRFSITIIFILFMAHIFGQSGIQDFHATKIISENCANLSYDGQDKLWINYNNALYEFNGREFSIFEKKNIKSREHSFLGNLYQNQYFRSNDQLFSYNKLEESVIPLDLPKRENIQFASIQENMLLCQQNGLFTIFDLKSVPKTIFKTNLPTVNSSIILNGQEIWLGTAQGLRIIKNGKLKSEQHVFSLFQTPIDLILKDEFENIWIISTEDEIYKYNGSRLINVQDKVAAIKIKIADAVMHENQLWTIHPMDGLCSFNTTNGVWTRHFKQDSIPYLAYKEIVIDNYNHLWLAGTKGLLRIDLSLTPLPPKLHFEDIRVLFKSLFSAYNAGSKNKLIQDYTLEPDENYLSFSFSAGNLGSEAIQYQYFLDGYNESWSPWNYETAVNYSDLPPGNYRFRVRASANGNTTEISSGLFKIESPVWTKERLKSFLLLTGASILLLTAYIIYKNQQKKILRLKMDLELREASLAWQQKALQLQMNPHFIFNVLNSIKGMIAESNTKAARNQIQTFSNFLRGMLDHSRSKLISLKDEIQFLEQYLKLEQSMQSQAFEYVMEIDPGLAELNPDIPPMMTQVFLENAIKHGFKNIGHKGVLSIQADIFGQNVRFSIRDNGQGRANAKALNTDHTSHAIQVIEDRLKALAPNTKIDRVKLVDLVDDNGKASGTLVILILPMLQDE